MSYVKYIFFIVCLLALPKASFAATCTWQNGGVNNNWSTAGNWSGCGGVAPTAADDVVVSANYAMTIDGTSGTPSVARSVDFTGYTNTLTMGSTAVLTIGDGTAGAGNVALKMPSGFTFSPNSAATINFISTSATQQTVTMNSGYSMPNLTFNSASNGDYAITANFTMNNSSTLNLTKGTLHLDGASDNSGLTHTIGTLNFNNTNVRTLYFGNVTLNFSSGSVIATTVTNLTVPSNTGTLRFSSTGNFTSGAFNFNGLSLEFNGTSHTLNCTNSTFLNITRTGTSAKTNTFALANPVTVTGTLTINGNSAVNRMVISSNGIGTQRTITLTGASATTSITNTDFQDIAFAQGTGGPSMPIDLSAISGGSGDALGNSNITFTSATTTYWIGNSGNWSDTAEWSWGSGLAGSTTRVPLPQDTVVFDVNSFSGTGFTVTNDMPRLGAGITWSVGSDNPTWTFGSAATWQFFGSLTLSSGMTVSGAGGIQFSNRSAETLTTNGVTMAMTGGMSLSMVGGSLTLQDALTRSGSISLTTGTFDANDFNVTATSFSQTNAAGAILNMGNGTWTVTTTGTCWNIAGTSAVVNAEGSTIIISNATATSKTFLGSEKTFNILTITGQNVIIASSNTFNTLNLNNPGMIGTKFTAGTTQTLANFSANGSAGNLISASSTTATPAFIHKYTPGTVCTDYVNISDLSFSFDKIFYFGLNSVDGGGNTQAYFSSCPVAQSYNTESRYSTSTNEKIRGGFKVRGGVKFR